MHYLLKSSARALAAIILPLCLASCALLHPSYPLPSGHRGDRDAGADNSRRSIQHAIDLGIPYAETDLRYTLDHKFVLYHDHKLHHELVPVLDVPENTAISDIPFEKLRSVQIPHGDGTLLDFDEVLEMITRSHTTLQLDLKGESDAMAKEVAEIVRKHHAQKNILTQCQQVETARFLREKFPDMPILAIAHEEPELPAFLLLHPDVMQIVPAMTTPENIAAIRKTGAPVLIKAVDTIYDNPRGWRHLKGLGADIVLTDHPQALARVY